MLFLNLYFKNIFKRKIINKLKLNNNSSKLLINSKIYNLHSFSKLIFKLFLIYILIIFLGGLLLSIPGFIKAGEHVVYDSYGNILGKYKFEWNYLIGLFTASSAFSDTGIVISNPAFHYSFWGQLIILILIKMGGFGIIAFKVIIFSWFKFNVSIKDLILAQRERGSNNFKHTIDVIKNNFIFLIILEIIGSFLLFFNFYFFNLTEKQEFMISNITYHNFWLSLWSCIFHSISSINNAGFDIIGNSSLIPYNNNYFIQFVFLFQFIIGGLGFPTFYDLKCKFISWLQKKYFKITLFSKINLITYFSLSIISVFNIWVIEFININITINNDEKCIESVLWNSTSNWNGFMNIFFNTMSTRNAGYSTVDINKFLPASRIIMSIMMFIGSAPSSTAGGIKTTTFAVILITIWSIIKKNNNVSIFRRKIPSETIKKSLVIMIFSGFLVLFATIFISAENSKLDSLNIFFTVCSVFGTTGLSTLNFLELINLGVLSTLILILLMLIGQLGISSFLLLLIFKKNKDISYVEENILIG